MMKEDYRIEFLDEKDINIIIDIVRNSFNSIYLIPSIYRGDGISKFISRELENEFSAYRYFVIKDNNSIAGFAEYKLFESSSTAFLNMICVHNDFKNKGIANKLFDFAKSLFIKQGFAQIALDVYESNDVALNWYKKCGFELRSSNSFFEINSKNQSVQPDNIYIQNFPQYKELQKEFGFYFLDIVIKEETARLGTIGNDLIVRGKYSLLLEKNISFLSKSLKIKKIYFIGNENISEDFKFIDKIVRMELNLNI